jgi:hypothetical protein
MIGGLGALDRFLADLAADIDAEISLNRDYMARIDAADARIDAAYGAISRPRAETRPTLIKGGQHGR